MTPQTHPDLLTWRPAVLADVPQWLRLLREIEAADDPSERASADELEEHLDQPWAEPADTLLGVDDAGTPRAFASLTVRPGDVDVVRAFAWGGVHPGWRGRGIGSTILARQRSRALEKVPAGSHGRTQLRAFVDEHLDGARTLLEDHGYAASRWFVDMSRALDGDLPAVALTGGLRLVRFEPDLSERVRLAHNEAFAEHWGSQPRTAEDWARSTVGTKSFRPSWSFVVLDGDDVSGYALSGAYEQDWEAQGHTEGWTDLLGVRPAWRRRGVAPALLAASMAAFAAAGMDRAGLGVDTANGTGALDLYRRLGYVEERSSVAYVRPLDEGGAPTS